MSTRTPTYGEFKTRRGSNLMDRATPNPPPPIDDDCPNGEQALVMWLRWNDAYEQINQELFEARQDPFAVEALLQQLDELRASAVAASKAALRRS